MFSNDENTINKLKKKIKKKNKNQVVGYMDFSPKDSLEPSISK
jgi:hypothetical protein